MIDVHTSIEVLASKLNSFDLISIVNKCRSLTNFGMGDFSTGKLCGCQMMWETNAPK